MFGSAFSENRRTLALAAPIAAGHVGQMLMGWVDTIMVARLGIVPLGACAFANNLLSVPLVFGFGVLAAVSVRVAHARGSGDPSNAQQTVRGGFVIALALGAVAVVLAYAAMPLLSVFGQPAEVNRAISGYMIFCAWSLVAVFITCVPKNFCEAMGHPWAPFWILLGGVLLNAVLNFILIYGYLGFPAMGLDGAGLATLIARVAAALALLLYPPLVRGLRSAWPVTWFAPCEPSVLRLLLLIGLPAGALHLAEVSGFAFGSLMMGWIGVEAMAAHQIAITCAATTFMVALGISQAVCVRIGQVRGAGETYRARPIVFGAMAATMGFMALAALVFTFYGRAIAGWFVSEEDVIAMTAQLLFLAALFQLFDGLQVVSSGALRGFEDTRVPMVIGMISYWAIALPVSWFAGFVFGYGASGVWMGFIVGLGVAGLALGWRILRKVSPNSLIPIR